MPKLKKSVNGQVKTAQTPVLPKKKIVKSIDDIISNSASEIVKDMKLNNLKQINGKTEQTAENFKKSTIYQILGDTGGSKYGTMELEEYQKKINEMNKYDLNVHASQVGVFPYDNRERLQKELINEFRRHVSSYRIPELPKNNNTKVSPEVLKIMAEGR